MSEKPNAIERLAAWLKGDYRYVDRISTPDNGYSVRLRSDLGGREVRATATTLSEALNVALDRAEEAGL